MSTPKILYITGYERSGSTILQNVLAQARSAFAVGEMREVWQRGILENRPCGCGEKFRDCPIWTSVFRRVFGEATPDGDDFDWMRDVNAERLRSYQSRIRNRHFPLIFLPRGPQWMEQRVNGYPDILRQLYEKTVEVSETNLVVDTSKSPVYAYILSEIAGLDVHLLHLVRDSRAVTYSIQKRKERGHGGYANYFPLRTAVEWGIINTATRWIGTRASVRYKPVRYEDFTTNPQRLVREIYDWVGEDSAGIEFEGPHTVRLSPTHTVVGSPHRFKTGQIDIRHDNEWRDELSRRDANVVEWSTRPLLSRHGYI